ncbi:hypothetical protein D3C84_313200 [compost metagenome]
MQLLRFLLSSNALLALVAIQVFLQVWLLAVDAPFTGLFITIWLSWKLGCLAGYADVVQKLLDHAGMVAKEMAELQDEYEAMSPDMQLELGVHYTRAMIQLTHLHQLLIEQSKLPRVKPKFRDMLPSPAKWLARRRERKIMATDKVLHA